MADKNKQTYKQTHGTTRVGDFLRTIKGIAPEILEIAGTVTGFDGLTSLGKWIDQSPELTQEQKQMALELAKLDYEDVKDARDMQKVALQQDDIFSKRFIYWFALLISAFSMVFIIGLFFIEIPENNMRQLDMVLGVVIGSGLVSIINYFFGSSKGSKDKTEMMKF